MFRKRQKKQFPPGTFIQTSARICAIIQLCLAFTVILWNLAQPFTGELFSLKSDLLLYHDVVGKVASSDTVNNNDSKTNRLLRNATRFNKLSVEERNRIEEGLENRQKHLQNTFLDKLKHSFDILVFKLPPFEQGWLFFSILISILLLKKVEGARVVVWLLPLLAFFYAIDNRLENPPVPTAESLLFPSEPYLLATYLKEPLNNNIFEQQEQLKKGWELYLISEWTKQKASSDPLSFENQVEEGEFAFNLERLKHKNKIKSLSLGSSRSQEPLSILAIYLFWNIFFAYTVFKKS